jgi:MFS family permease
MKQRFDSDLPTPSPCLYQMSQDGSNPVPSFSSKSDRQSGQAQSSAQSKIQGYDPSSLQEVGTESRVQSSEKIGEFITPPRISTTSDPSSKNILTSSKPSPVSPNLATPPEYRLNPSSPLAEAPDLLGENGAPRSSSEPLIAPNDLPNSGGKDLNGAHNFPSTDPEMQVGTDEAAEHGFIPVLRNHNFLALWAGQVFSQLADKVYLVLMIMLIDVQFQSAGQTISGWVSSIMIAFTIPAVLFGSIAGVYVDHWSKKAVLVATNLLRGVFVLALPALLWISAGWSPLGGIPIGFAILLGSTFLVSTLTQFFAPAEQATIPLIVDRRHLLSANSLYTTTMMASVIIGFAVGEPLLAIADHLFSRISPSSPDIGKELLVGISYAIAGLLLLLMRTHEKADTEEQPPPHVWDNIRDGLRYLGQQPKVRAAMIQLVILFSIFAALAVLAVRLAEVMPALKSSQFGFLLSAGGVGMGIGAFLIGHGGQRFSRTQLSLYGSIGMAVSLAALSLFTHQLMPTLVVLVCLGAFAAMVGIPMQTTIQEHTPEEMRGKVFGLQNNAINVALSLPLALAGLAETYLGLTVVFLGLGAIAIAGTILTRTITHQGSSQSVS